MAERIVIDRYDRRVIERNLKSGQYTKEELEMYLSSLEDATELSQPCPVNQDDEIAEKEARRREREDPSRPEKEKSSSSPSSGVSLFDGDEEE